MFGRYETSSLATKQLDYMRALKCCQYLLLREKAKLLAQGEASLIATSATIPIEHYP